MTDIVLATANARYAHSSLGLRSLKANLGELEERATILELTIDERAIDMAEKILAVDPKVVGLGVYIWNVALLTEVVAILKRIRPELPVVLGGPEVSFDIDQLSIARDADYIVSGEGETAFAELADQLLANRAPSARWIAAAPPDLDGITLPHHLYCDEDIAHRVIYVEASRGCPFGCQFCLASLDKKVRRFPQDELIEALGSLWARGARRFKLVDRALHLAGTDELLGFFLERAGRGAFVHFELVPTHLPGRLFAQLQRFPAGSVQLEVGVQTLSPEVASRIGRKQDPDQVLAVISRLRQETGAHLHTDLVVGLPGETLEEIGSGFDRLVATTPHEIQVGILKRLRGAPISMHDGEWAMRYNPHPPYELLASSTLPFETMQRLKRFSRYFDLVVNSGNFASTAPLLWRDRSPFEGFLEFSDWLFGETGRTSAIARARLKAFVADFLVAKRGVTAKEANHHIDEDTHRARATRHDASSLPPRQRRHAGEP